MERRPALERSLYEGRQRLYRFANGYGASVVRHATSYGNDEGLWEMAVILWVPREGGPFEGWDFDLQYNTPITNDVLGFLTEDAIEETLTQIELLAAIAAAEGGVGDALPH